MSVVSQTKRTRVTKLKLLQIFLLSMILCSVHQRFQSLLLHPQTCHITMPANQLVTNKQYLLLGEGADRASGDSQEFRHGEQTRVMDSPHQISSDRKTNIRPAALSDHNPAMSKCDHNAKEERRTGMGTVYEDMITYRDNILRGMSKYIL